MFCCLYGEEFFVFACEHSVREDFLAEEADDEAFDFPSVRHDGVAADV